MVATWCLILPLALALLAPPAGPPTQRLAGAVVGAVGVQGGWDWPVIGPVVRDFDPPEDPYGSGHRGIDIAAPIGTPILAPQAGVVTFAGSVGGQLFVTLDHGGGVRSSYSWLSSILVSVGDAVPRAASLGLTGLGHPGSIASHLHFGVRLDDVYVDPLAFLGPAPVTGLVHLAPDVGAAA